MEGASLQNKMCVTGHTISRSPVAQDVAQAEETSTRWVPSHVQHVQYIKKTVLWRSMKYMLKDMLKRLTLKN